MSATRRTITGAIAVVAAGGLVTAGQSEGQPVFTAEQAAAGKTAYASACARCHMPDLGGSPDAAALAGTTFLDTWRARTTKDLYDFVAGSMPPGGSTMSPETYAAIVAFVLRSNGATPGSTRLEPSTTVPLERVVRTGEP